MRNAKVTVYHKWDESLVSVKSLDDATHTLTFDTPTTHPAGGWGVTQYVVWNVREGMQEPGQWYLDRTRGKLVYWPLPGENLAYAKVVAPTTETVICLVGTEAGPICNVTLRGLCISATTTPAVPGNWAADRYAGAVEALFANDCRFADLTIANVGGQALKLTHCERPRVERCEARATGAGGIHCCGRSRHPGRSHRPRHRRGSGP